MSRDIYCQDADDAARVSESTPLESRPFMCFEFEGNGGKRIGDCDNRDTHHLHQVRNRLSKIMILFHPGDPILSLSPTFC